MTRKSFTTFDIVLMALLAVANGILTKYLSMVNQQLTAWGGPIATSTITGIYMVYGVLAIYIIRKPGAALITYLIGATVQGLLSTSYGMASAYVAAICYAVAIEGVFALFRYKKWTYLSVMTASVCAVPLWFACAAYLYGYLKWDLSVLLWALVVRCLSGLVLCGLLTKSIGDALAAMGLLRRYASGAGKRNLQQ